MTICSTVSFLLSLLASLFYFLKSDLDRLAVFLQGLNYKLYHGKSGSSKTITFTQLVATLCQI